MARAGIDDADDRIAAALSSIDEFPLSRAVLARARSVGPSTLRSLDARHLASAVLVGAPVVLTYDDRLAGVARLAGLSVLAPPV